MRDIPRKLTAEDWKRQKVWGPSGGGNRMSKDIEPGMWKIHQQPGAPMFLPQRQTDGSRHGRSECKGV